MQSVIAKCGIRCDLCPAYHANLKSPQDKLQMSKAFEKYYEFTVTPDQIKPCKGCADAADPPQKDCAVFPCARSRNIPNCAHCGEFPCDKMEEQFQAMQNALARHKNIPPHDFQKYIKPFLCRETLTRIRNSLEK